MNTTIFGWNTTKTAQGFQFNVTRAVTRNTPNASGHYADTATVKTGFVSSRAIAKAHAQKWVRYLRSQEASA